MNRSNQRSGYARIPAHGMAGKARLDVDGFPEPCRLSPRLRSRCPEQKGQRARREARASCYPPSTSASRSLFGAYIWWSFETGLLVTEDGTHAGISYFTGFFIEKSLSIDNVFVISLIFSYFAIPRKYQYRALVWGIVGVIVLRGIMIARRRCAGAGIRLDALPLRRLPDRDRHQDAARARERTGHRRRIRWCASCASTCG